MSLTIGQLENEIDNILRSPKGGRNNYREYQRAATYARKHRFYMCAMKLYGDAYKAYRTKEGFMPGNVKSRYETNHCAVVEKAHEQIQYYAYEQLYEPLPPIEWEDLFGAPLTETLSPAAYLARFTAFLHPTFFLYAPSFTGCVWGFCVPDKDRKRERVLEISLRKKHKHGYSSFSSEPKDLFYDFDPYNEDELRMESSETLNSLTIRVIRPTTAPLFELDQGPHKNLVTTKIDDFRPALHQYLIDVFIPGVAPPQEDATTMDILPLLFPPEECTALEQKIKQAQLKIGQYASVPKLNLGFVQLPNPGQRNIKNDSYVVDGGLFLVEHLSTLGVMSRAEAECLIARKLEHYLLHKSGYQLSRRRAQEIMHTLDLPNKEAAS